MARNVNQYVRSSDKCQRVNGDRPQQNLLQPLSLPRVPWEEITMDLVTGLPTSSQGHDAMFTFVDRLTKCAHFAPTTSRIDAQEAAELYISNVYRLYGLSRSTICDRDPRFTTDFCRCVFQQLGVKLKFSTSNHPQTDSQSERTNRSIAQLLRSVIDHRQGNWEEMLPICEFAFNNQVQAPSNETPFYLNYGLHPQSVADISLSAE